MTFTSSDVTYQTGIAPIRIDELTRITGVDFSGAWQDRVAGTMFGIPVNFISLDHLIANKRATGRSTDLEQLKYISKQANPNDLGACQHTQTVLLISAFIMERQSYRFNWLRYS
jgi:hypothetical protein